MKGLNIRKKVRKSNKNDKNIYSYSADCCAMVHPATDFRVSDPGAEGKGLLITFVSINLHYGEQTLYL